MKNEQNLNAKEKKFVENMEKVKNRSITIFFKYSNLQKKLAKDKSETSLKYQKL
jgi:hypothetical protein